MSGRICTNLTGGPGSDAELIKALIDLWPKIMPYAISFLVLGSRWLDNVEVRSRAEHFQGSYVKWWLFYLLQVTCMPFTTIVLGRFAYLAPAVWLYLANTALISIAAWKLLQLTPELEDETHRSDRQLALYVALASILLCFMWSFHEPTQSMWWLLMNALTPRILGLRGRRSSANS